MIYVLLSFAVGVQGGMFELQGDDIVSSSFGPSFGGFCDVNVTPNLSYSMSFIGGKAETSSNSAVLDSLMQPLTGVVGHDFQCFQGVLSVGWAPLTTSFSPYLSGRLGLSQWKIIDSNGDVALSLNGNNFEGLSLFLGGGAGIRGRIAGFLIAVEGFSDFVFSENKAWDKGFGMYDDNEWTVNFMFKLGKEF